MPTNRIVLSNLVALDIQGEVNPKSFVYPQINTSTIASPFF